MKRFISVFVCLSLTFAITASAQLTFTSGVNPAAGPNGNYAAVQFWNFSNSGGSGEFTSGTGNNSNGPRYQTWGQQVWGVSFTYVPADVYSPNQSDSGVSVNPSGVIRLIAASSVSPTELQILVGNTGPGDLTLTLTSINSVAYGGILNGPDAYVFGGTPPNFAPGSTWSAANGTTLQAYLDNPTLFSSAFTLHGTITLDAPANSANYGDNLNSLIEFNLTSVPEPSSWALIVSGACLLGVFRQRLKT